MWPQVLGKLAAPGPRRPHRRPFHLLRAGPCGRNLNRRKTVGNEPLCAMPTRVPTSPNKPVESCPLVAEPAGTVGAHALARLLSNWRALGKSLNLSGRLFYFLESEKLKETVCPQSSWGWDKSENCCPAPEGAWLSKILSSAFDRYFCPHWAGHHPPFHPPKVF